MADHASPGSTMVEIRQIHEEDAEHFLTLCRQVDLESRFMLLEPSERRDTVEEQRQKIRRVLSNRNQTILVADNNGVLVGYLVALGGAFARNYHSAQVVVGVRKELARQGIGQRLFQALERWARPHGIHRLELTVVVSNMAAVSLYKKVGFTVEGTRRHALRVSQEFVDEYYMAKLISPEAN